MCLQRLGWESKTDAQNDTSRDMKNVAENTLQGAMRGAGPHSAIATAPLLKGAGNHFKLYHELRTSFEAANPRTELMVANLRQAAQGYIDHFDNDYSKKDKTDAKNLAKKAACEDTLKELRRFDVALEIGKLPDPPWDTEGALKAAALKTEQDIASLPPGRQRAQPLGGDHLSPAFWIEKRNDRGQNEKTYIFKPSAPSQQPGYPDGGEPAREAMSGRVADMLNGALGLTLPVPETQVISLGKESLPPEALKDLVDHDKLADQPTYTGSVQQVAAGVTGDMTTLSTAQMGRIDTRSVQELAVLDIITLNTDRHAGNMLVKPGAQPNDPPGLVPIDNGLAFPTKGANQQMTANIGSTHNALMRVPGSHEPFTQEMQQSLAQLDPDLLANALKRERETLTNAHPSLDNTLADESIEMSRRSAMFLKRAAPTLSPAAIQTALSQHNAEIFDLTLDNNAFNTMADRIIQQMAQQAGPLKEYFTMPAEMQRKMKSDLAALGWQTGRFQSGDSILTNPAMALRIWKSGIRCPDTGRDPNRRPFDLTGTPQDDQDVQAARRAFPQTKEPTNDNQKRAILEDWQEWQRLGGTQAGLLEAITQTGVRADNIAETQQTLDKALKCLKQARGLTQAIANDATDLELATIRSTTEYVRGMARYLTPQQQGPLNRVIGPITIRLQQPQPMSPQEKQLALQALQRVRDPLLDAATTRLKTKLTTLIATTQDEKIKTRAKEVMSELQSGALNQAYEYLNQVDPVLANAA